MHPPSPTSPGSQHIPLESRLSVSAKPFISTSAAHRPVGEILGDYSEVETVVLGGTGTSQPVQELWVPSTNRSPVGQNTQDSFPFTECSEIPLCVPCPAKPVIKTSSLPEFKLQLPDSVFIDRKLPAPVQPLTAHPRFTPAYYVALHNLAASSGHDG